jgi:hypothetical protein
MLNSLSRVCCGLLIGVFMTAKTQNWSHDVTVNSDALDLEVGVFTWHDPKKIALSLQKSALASHRRKSSPLQSAMSMLNFYINRAGSHLPQQQKDILEQAKIELHNLFLSDKKHS